MIGMTLDAVLEQQGYTSLPLVRTSVGQLGVDALVNGSMAKFLVDTGASATVIDRASAQRWGLDLDECAEAAVGCMVPGGMAMTKLDELRIASVRFIDFEVAVVDLSHVNAGLEQKGADRIDGVIGADIMDEREAVIAYAQRTLHLKK